MLYYQKPKCSPLVFHNLRDAVSVQLQYYRVGEFSNLRDQKLAAQEAFHSF